MCRLQPAIPTPPEPPPCSDLEDHVLGARLLSHLPIHTQLELQLLYVHTILHGRSSGGGPQTSVNRTDRV